MRHMKKREECNSERCDMNIERKKNYIILLIVVTAVVLLYNNSFYWPSGEFEHRKVIVQLVSIVCILVVPIFAVKIKKINNFICKQRLMLHNLCAFVRKRWKKVCLYLIMYIAALFVAYFFVIIIERFHYHEGFNINRFYLLVTILWLVLTYFLMRKIAFRKPEVMFLLTILIIGTFFIKVSPINLGVSWDDEIHYERTLVLANCANGIMYKADMKNIDDQLYNLENHLGYDRISKESYSNELEKIYNNKELVQYSFDYYGVWILAYIPSAIGIILARGLCLPYTYVFMMGKFFNLLMYSALICLAIRKINYGKILIAVIGLIPTNVFMAASYAYDPWVIGFIILGFSYFFSMMQDEKKINTKDMLICITMFVLGCLPKAIYFPVLFPLLFVPKKKYKSDKEWKITILLILAAGVFLVMTFLMPMLLSGPGTGDVRGGSDVNSTEQIKFILENSIYYIRILYCFFKSYLAIDSIGYGFQHFAYMGYGMFWGIVTLIVVVVAFLDRDERKSVNVWIKVSGIIGCLAAIILATTALYISFTGVGANTVAGMHDRYVFPLIFPILYFIGVDGGRHAINKNVFACLPMFIIALTFLYNINMLCVSQY